MKAKADKQREEYEKCYNPYIKMDLKDINCLYANLKTEKVSSNFFAVLVALVGLHPKGENLYLFYYAVVPFISSPYFISLVEVIALVIFLIFIRDIKKCTFKLSILDDIRRERAIQENNESSGKRFFVTVNKS